MLFFRATSGRRGRHASVHTGADYATHQAKVRKLVAAYMRRATWETREDFLDSLNAIRL